MKKPVTQINAPADSCNPVVRDNLLKMIAEKGVRQGVISKHIARQLYPKARTGQELLLGPARLVVGK